MQKVDLKAQIEHLSKLQELDTEIYDLKQEKESKPQEIKILEDAFTAKKAHLAEFEKAFTDLQKDHKAKELEVATKEEEAKKLKNQLYSLKTNKEYQAMLGQIEGVKANTSAIEDKILELFDKMDKLKSEVSAEKERLKEEEAKFNEEKKKVDTRLKEIDGRLSQLDAQRKQALPEVDPKLLKQYERILASRDGLALVAVKNNSCAGCNMQVPPQVINLIKMRERLVTCEICNRIMFIEE